MEMPAAVDAVEAGEEAAGPALPAWPPAKAPAAAAPPASAARTTHFSGPCMMDARLFGAPADAASFFGSATY
jgi:hypothetical protein